MGQLSETITSGATSDAFDPRPGASTQSCVIYGKTGRGLMGWVGWAMSKGAKWLREEKSLEITGYGILLSLGFISLFLGLWIGLKYERSRNDSFWMSGKSYQMAGLALVPGEKDVYIPVYKEKNR